MDRLQTLDSMAVLLLDAAAKGTVLLLLAWIAVRLCARSSAAVRHAIWSLSMAGLVLMPVASAALPAWRLPILPAVEPVVAPVVGVPRPVEAPGLAPVVERPRPVPRDLPRVQEATRSEPVAAPAVAAPVAPVVASEVPAAPTLTARQWTSLGICSAWAVGVLLWGGALLIGMRRTMQLRRRTVLLADPEWVEMVQTLKQRLSLRRSVELREHPDAVVPMTWGVLKPIVLLPRQARAWDESMRRAVLLHELAHVRRGDVASQLIGRVACVLYWFHPLAWYALRRLRQEREQACDDAVVQSGEKASDYAEQLLAVAKRCRGPGGLSLGVAMAEGTSLERRVISLFDSARSHGPLTNRVALASLVIGGAILAGLASIQPTAAESEPAIQASEQLDDDLINSSQQVTGVVVDSQNNPVAGAVVWCDVDQDKTTRQPVTVRVETNAQGEFTFTVPKSSLDFGQGHFKHAAWAWKQGHGIGVGVAVASTRLPKNPTVRLHLPETAAVALQVVDEKGQPLAGAEVATDRLLASQVPGMPPDGPFSMVVRPPKELLAIATQKTDAEGRVTLDLVPRRYLRSVQVSSMFHGGQSFLYPSDILKLGAVASVEGELSNHQAGVRLSLTTYQTRPQTEKPGPREILSANVQVVTDAQGRFSVPVFPIGEYTGASEELNGPQFLSASTAKGELVAGSNKLSLEVIAGIPVKGRVIIRGENKGVANAALHVETYKNFESGPVVHTLCQTNENGEYSSFTLPGHYVASSLASVGSDETLIHPRMSSYPPTFQQPPQLATNAKEAVIPEISVDRGQAWLGTLVDEQQTPIVGAFVVPMRNGNQLSPPFPTGQGGAFGFLLLKGVTPEAWHLVVKPDEPYATTLPLQVVTKEPLVLRTQRATIPQSDPDQAEQSWNPLEDYTGGFSPEEIEESQVTAELKDVLTKAGLTADEQAQLDQVAADEMVGVVLDAATRQPVEGATIEFMCRSPKSNAATSKLGLFRVGGFPPQEPAIVIVRKSGFAPRFFMRPPGGTGWVILLDNRTYFEGTITDKQGQPVGGATIRATWEAPMSENPDEGGMPMDTETISLADGTYRLCVPGLMEFERRHAEYRGFDIQVVASGRGSVQKPGNFIGPHSVVPLSLQLQAPANFAAQIVDSETGAPVPDYVLYTVDKPFRIGRSDAQGRLVIDDMTPGIVMFSTGEGEGKDGPDCVGCEGSKQFDQVAYARWWSPDVRKDEDGPYFGQLVLPQEGKFHGNFDLLHFDIQPDMAPAKVFVERSATISGRVTDPDGKPVAGGTVVPTRNGSSLTGDTRYSVKTDQDGRYVMHIPASKNSTYNILAHDGEYEQWRKWANGVNAPFQTTPGQTVENIDLQLTRPGRVTGRVLRKGQPVANYLVRTVASDLREHSYYNPATKTNADGTFEITHVRPGKHFLQVGFYMYGKDKDQGPVIEVAAGEVVADQLVEAKEERDPEEGVVKPPEPEPTVADVAPTPAAGTPPLDVVAEPMAHQPAPAGSKTVSGQIVNDLKLGIPNADVLIVAGADWNDSRDGQVIAQGKTDVLGNYSIAIPAKELAKRSWGQVWRRAPGFAATRGNTVQSLESLTQQPLQHGPLVSTEGLHLVVHDPAGKPLPNARVEAIAVKVNQGIGYTLPAAWRDDNSGVSDAEGRVHLPYIDPGSLNQLEITPEDSTSATRFSQNYFLNYRPEQAAPHFIFPTFETGTIEGQLVAGPGVTLPKDLKIPLMTLTGKVDVSGVREVTVDEAGRFQIPDMPVGEISILKFLDDAQPLRPWISERAYVKAGETTKLDIPIVTGTRVTGRVQKSDTQVGVADYEFEVYYGPAIKFPGSDLWLMIQPVKADADGKFALFLPPGPINLRLTRYVDGYSDATSWLPDEESGTWGPLHNIPAQPEFELPMIDLVRLLPVKGKLVDQNDQPLADDDWSVYGYPEIPGEEDRFVMNSVPGVETDKTGHFDGTYPEPYPPVRWKVSHRVWQTKYEFDDIEYAAEVVTRDPLLLRVDTTKPMAE